MTPEQQVQAAQREEDRIARLTYRVFSTEAGRELLELWRETCVEQPVAIDPSTRAALTNDEMRVVDGQRIWVLRVLAYAKRGGKL